MWLRFLGFRANGGVVEVGTEVVEARLAGLTLVAAVTDGISYLGLDRVFPVNMTGNTVLLGLGIASYDLPPPHAQRPHSVRS